jgi:nucleoside-diphosphate-sugar epimerase
MNAMVTGASGFVGSTLVEALRLRGIGGKCAVRKQSGTVVGQWTQAVVGDISGDTDWREALDGCDVVVHLAARVHQLHEDPVSAQAQYKIVNVDGTLNLARQAAECGVRRFVFLSSIKVHGESTTGRAPWCEADAPEPQDPYGCSKRDAEVGLLQISREHPIEVVIVRAPLVYGRGVKANFAALVQAVEQGWPMPLASVNNSRSLVGLDNLVDFIAVCMQHPAAANQVFLVSDARDVSTPELLKLVAQAARRPLRSFPFPSSVLRAMANLLGRSGAADRLLGSLQIDITKARKRLGWSPPFSMEENMARMFEKHSL